MCSSGNSGPWGSRRTQWDSSQSRAGVPRRTGLSLPPALPVESQRRLLWSVYTTVGDPPKYLSNCSRALTIAKTSRSETVHRASVWSRVTIRDQHQYQGNNYAVGLLRNRISRMLHNAPQCSRMLHNSPQWSRIQNAPQWSRMLHNALQCSTTLHNASQCSTMLHNAPS